MIQGYLGEFKTRISKRMQGVYEKVHVLTNEEGLVSDIKVQAPLGKSDHGIIILRIHCAYEQRANPSPRYLLNKGNYNQMREDLDIDWESLMEEKDVIQSWDLLKKDFSRDCYKQHTKSH